MGTGKDLLFGCIIIYIILLYDQACEGWQVTVSVGVAKEVHSDLWQCLGAEFC